MSHTKIENEIAHILALPTNELSFYPIDETNNFSLFIHSKYFDNWIFMYDKENVLLQLGRYLTDKFNISKHIEDSVGNHIEVKIKSETHAILLYKFDYINNRFITLSTVDTYDKTEQQLISLCTWKWFN